MSLTVLICDDSALARKQLARSLPEGWDVDISYATNGVEGLDAIRADKGELLFLDLNMPEMDGYQVLEEIRRADLSTMVIVVSGDIQPVAHAEVMALGALDFIKKPIDGEILLETLARYGLYCGEPAAAREIILDVDLRDCYQEIANVAMGQAADLLARLLNVFVLLPVPRVSLLEVSEMHMALQLAGHANTFSAICQGFVGDGVTGEALLIFNDSSFEEIAGLMKYEGELNDVAEAELLMDIASILMGAYLKGIGSQLDMHFSQGHPVVLGQHCLVSDLLRAAPRWKRTLAIEVNYTVREYNINCDLLLLFTEDTIGTMNRKVSGLLEQL